MTNFYAGIACGTFSANLAKKIAHGKGHEKVRIIDKIHAAMIVLSFISFFIILVMIPYFYPKCHELFERFIDWKGNSTFFTLLKVFIMTVVALPVTIFVINPLMHKLANLSVWYSLVLFILTATISTGVIAFACKMLG